MAPHTPGSLYEFQNKGLTKFAIHKLLIIKDGRGRCEGKERAERVRFAQCQEDPSKRTSGKTLNPTYAAIPTPPWRRKECASHGKEMAWGVAVSRKSTQEGDSKAFTWTNRGNLFLGAILERVSERAS